MTDELKEAKKMVQNLLGNTKEELALSEWVQNELEALTDQLNQLNQLKQQPDAANAEEG